MRSAPCCGRQCSYGLAPSDEPSVAHCRRRIVFKRLAPQVQSGRRQLSYSPGEQTGLARRLFLEFLELFAISMVTIELLHGERTMRRFLILAILIAPRSPVARPVPRHQRRGAGSPAMPGRMMPDLRATYELPALGLYRRRKATVADLHLLAPSLVMCMASGTIIAAMPQADAENSRCEDIDHSFATVGLASLGLR